MALTQAELERAIREDVDGVPKGQLALESGRIALRGVPAIAPSGSALLVASLARAFDDLRMVRLARRARGPSANADVQAKWPLFDGAIAAMQAEERQRGTTLALAYLPGLADLGAGPSELVRTKLAETARVHGVMLADLTLPMRKLRADSQDLAFIATAPAGTTSALLGQYSNIGHRLVARELAVQLRLLLQSAPTQR